mgnify:CR=1 FL=1
MNYKKLIAVGLLALLANAAAADMRTIVEAHEVRLSQFRAPASITGSVTFRACNSCPQKIVPVTPETRYLVNDKAVSLNDFRKAVLTVSNRERKYLVVSEHLESATIRSVSVSL